MALQPDFKFKQQNFSGIPNCFTEKPHRCIVLEVKLASDVQGEILQAAVDDVLVRAPYFADALAEHEGDFFYAENPLPFEVVEGAPRSVGGPETNWHCLDVTYEGNQMYFTMFHGFCDGMGLNMFVEAVINRYFCRKDGVDYPADGLRVPGQPVLESEEADPYSTPHELPEGFEMDFLADRFWRLPEVDEARIDHMRGVNFRIKESELMELVKTSKSSPVATLQVLMADAILSVHPDAPELFGALVPTSNREKLGTPNTFKNSNGALRLPYQRSQMDELDFAERCHLSRQLLREANDNVTARFMANETGEAVAKASQTMHSYKEKQEVLNFIKWYSNDSYMIDYLGSLHSKGFENQLVSVRYKLTHLEPNQGTLFLIVTATAGFFDIEMARSWESDVYVDAFAEQLKRRGIAFTQETEDRYLNPENGLIPALGYA
ncbi:MAG: hypothetical protein IJ125_01535 [Atopobiaceae bacterium]|nr:hypothetical protein [Atopobiaceae bacterium]